jgi:2-polyprenyl-3-methyl-5-hydroxy-6-metoxy-1,4-benzoquinol methylase
MSANYKERIYRDYYRLHILPRKGPLTKKQLLSAAKTFDFHFREFLPADRERPILDVGCGSGSLVSWLHSRGHTHAAGIDLSEDQIAAGRALEIPNLHNESLTDHLRRYEQRYALVFLRDVIEHIEPAGVLDFLDQVNSALAPGGKLVIQTPNGASPTFGRVLYGDFSHERAYTSTSLAQVLLLAGFENAVFKPFEPRLASPSLRALVTPRRWKELRRAIAWSFVKRFYTFLLRAELGDGDHIVTYNIIACATKAGTTGASDTPASAASP